MGKKQKLIRRLKALPKDFTYQEAVSLLLALGFEEDNAGKTSGSRVRFIKVVDNDFIVIRLHKPHPQKELRYYATKGLLFDLKEAGLI